MRFVMMLVLLSGCGSVPSGQVCTPGAVDDCLCHGVYGHNKCLDDGRGWGACDCSTSVPDLTVSPSVPDMAAHWADFSQVKDMTAVYPDFTTPPDFKKAVDLVMPPDLLPFGDWNQKCYPDGTCKAGYECVLPQVDSGLTEGRCHFSPSLCGYTNQPCCGSVIGKGTCFNNELECCDSVKKGCPWVTNTCICGHSWGPCCGSSHCIVPTERCVADSTAPFHDTCTP